MPGYQTLTAQRPSAAARSWDWRDLYRSEPLAAGDAGRAGFAPEFAPQFAIASSLGQSHAWDVDYARPRLEQVADLQRFRARFWQATLPALGLFWAGVIWALVA